MPEIDPNLPPAGYERDEELRRRQDNLEQAAEQLADTMETGSIDPHKLEVENELAEHFDELKVSNQLPEYHYCWVNSGFYMRFVKAKLARKWEIVQGDMPEAQELKGMMGDTVRRLGDVILMRIRKDLWIMEERARRVRQQNFEGSDKAAFIDKIERYSSKIGQKIPWREANDDSSLKRMYNQEQAQETAGRKVDQLIREGRMPGVRSPGR